jgi:hypothetical protein
MPRAELTRDDALRVAAEARSSADTIKALFPTLSSHPAEHPGRS